MDLLDRETLVSLASHSGWPSLSLYLPTHRRPLDTSSDRIRMKNLVRDACSRLVAEGMRETDAEKFCAPLRALVDDQTFWLETGDGLAVFLSADGLRVLRADAPMPEQVVLGDRFYVRPMLVASHANEMFFALALDKNGTRLFRGDHTSIEEISLPESTPKSADELLKYDEAQRDVIHASFAPGRSAANGMQHGGIRAGYGAEKDAASEHTSRFAKAIARGVAEVLKGENSPLVLLGVDRQIAAYRLVNEYHGLTDAQVTGTSDRYRPHEVHELALKALAPHFARAANADLDEITERTGSGMASRDLAEIVSAAARGRVRKLLVDEGSGPFGTFDRETMEVRQVCDDIPRLLRESANTGVPKDGCGWDLIDLAVAETMLHGGEVMAFTGEHAPVHGAAALMRF